MNAPAKPLRVLQVNSLFSGGGADNQTLELATGLRELGEEVMLAVPRGSRWEPLARQRKLALETFAARGPLKLAMILHWARILRERDIQVLHVHQGRDYWPGILAARLAGRGTRVVVTRHLMTRPRLVSRWLLLSMSDVIAVSGAALAVLQRELRGPAARLHQIYGGIDVNAFQPARGPASESFRAQQGWAPDAVAFGVVGAYGLPRGKGQLEFLAAAARMRADFPQARFAIIGQGSMESLLRERIAALDLRDVAHMIPFTDELAPVMGALDVLVHPAVGTDAFPLVVLEALASGKPVVASRLDGIPEEIQDGRHGLLVPPGDVPALADAMRTLLGDAALRQRLGAAGRERVCQHFSRARLAREVRELYCRLCAPK
jgi:glycosyltransferase involved in cell wall biosynthesis